MIDLLLTAERTRGGGGENFPPPPPPPPRVCFSNLARGVGCAPGGGGGGGGPYLRGRGYPHTHPLRGDSQQRPPFFVAPSKRQNTCQAAGGTGSIIISTTKGDFEFCNQVSIETKGYHIIYIPAGGQFYGQGERSLPLQRKEGAMEPKNHNYNGRHGTKEPPVQPVDGVGCVRHSLQCSWCQKVTRVPVAGACPTERSEGPAPPLPFTPCRQAPQIDSTVCRHAYGHVHGHVYGHVCRHVCGHMRHKYVHRGAS